MKKRNFIQACILAVLLAALFLCVPVPAEELSPDPIADPPGETVETDPAETTHTAARPKSWNVIRKKTLTLRRWETYRPEYSLCPGDAVVSWTSSDRSVAGVTKKGTVKAKKTGTATIRVRTRFGYTDSVRVKVRKVRIAIAGKVPNGGTHAWILQSLGCSVTQLTSSDFDVGRYDGLVVPGGEDVHPSLYGEGFAGAKRCDIALDRLQIRCIRKFCKAEKPILGICKGEQILNVALGGTLKQNIGWHGSRTKLFFKKGWVRDLLGRTAVVQCTHHQAVKKLAKGLRVVSRAADGNIEAYEHETLPVAGLQFHPENSGSVVSKAVFLGFARRCANYRAQ